MRIIGRIDIKNNFVLKGINLEGLRKIGNPEEIILKYYKENIDELFIIDAVASLYGRNNLFELIKNITKDIFIPITLGGGIRSLGDIEESLKSGADKVAINSKIFENPGFLKSAVKNFGESTIVVNIEAKKMDENHWEPYKYYGRERTKINLIDWLNIVQDNGCGEILITSIDQEGTESGLDFNLIKKIYDKISKPLIISGGCSGENDIIKINKMYKDTSVAVASILHYNKVSIMDLKKNAK